MRFEIETRSYTAIGSGEGAGIIDTELVTHGDGLPYIPAKRIKGVLLESATEVTEMLGLEKTPVDSLFGVAGVSKGKIWIGNLEIRNYEKISQELKNFRVSKRFKGLTSREKILSHFSDTRQNTSIDLETEVAKEHTLRTFRVLKPGTVFETEIEVDSLLSEREKAILYLACLNVRRIGLKRNRGFGKVRTTIKDVDINSIDHALELLNQPCETEKPSKRVNERFSFGKDNRPMRLSYTIKTDSPLVISKRNGDQSMIDSLEIIPGTTVRGILADRLIRSRDLVEAHNDELFFELILNGKLRIEPAFPMADNITYYPTPLNIHRIKDEQFSDRLINVFDDELKETVKSRPLGGFSILEDDNVITSISIKKDVQFHNTRDRKTGHNTDGSLFYYESLEAGQEFSGFIVSSDDILATLPELLGKEFRVSIGKSSSSQYGNARFAFGAVEDISEPELEEPILLVVASPVILHNDFGFPDANENRLRYEIEQVTKCEISIERAVISTESFDNYVGIWRMNNEREISVAPGSSFIVSKSSGNDVDFLNGIKRIIRDGLGERTTEGFGKLRIVSSNLSEAILRKKEEDLGSTPVSPEYSLQMIREIMLADLTSFAAHRGFLKLNSHGKNKDNPYLTHITNHLAGRILYFLSKANTKRSFLERLEQLYTKSNANSSRETKVPKKAANSLEKAGIMNELKAFDEPVINEIKQWQRARDIDILKIDLASEEIKFDLAKSYWTAFFRFVRILHKKRGGD